MQGVGLKFWNSGMLELQGPGSPVHREEPQTHRFPQWLPRDQTPLGAPPPAIPGPWQVVGANEMKHILFYIKFYIKII